MQKSEVGHQIYQSAGLRVTHITLGETGPCSRDADLSIIINAITIKNSMCSDECNVHHIVDWMTTLCNRDSVVTSA